MSTTNAPATNADVQKIFLPASTQTGNRNIIHCEPIDVAAWLWHPKVEKDDPAFLRFGCDFASDGSPLTFHLTADQHYILFLDGERIARGPDRSDIEHWSFSSFTAKLSAGSHRFEVAVWNLGAYAPLSLMTHRGGFVLAADGDYYAPQLCTGMDSAPWMVTRYNGWTMTAVDMNSYHVIGDSLHIDAATWHQAEQEWTQPIVIREAIVEADTGVDLIGGWRCYPSTIPALLDTSFTCGTIRACADVHLGQSPYDKRTELFVTKAQCADVRIPAWQALLDNQTSVEIPAHTTCSVLWDLEDYCVGYHQIEMHGGAGSEIACLWAESLFEEDSVNKGNRNDIIGKQYIGFGNTYTTDGEQRGWIPAWFCSGRYVLLEITTKDQPLSIDKVSINEVRYPLENESQIDIGDAAMDGVVDLSVRVLQSCSHDHLVDCPYYEQMMYVGDTRLELLALYGMTEDVRLPERCITLFDFSRRAFGFVAERYTAREDQQSNTFAAIWVLCVRDYALWRDNPSWVQERMIGVRANLDCFLPYRNDSGLIESISGWSFIDWVSSWTTGYGPGHATGRCAMTNMFYLLALQAASELEQMHGSAHLAAHYTELAEQTAESIQATFYCHDGAHAGMYADDAAHEHFSQHAQCLAIIAKLVPERKRSELMGQTLADDGLAQCSIYFRFYLFEALQMSGRGKDLLAEYDGWKALKEMGLYTCIESSVSSRSDCHAWGSHAFHHLIASVGGIRPASAGFKDVLIAPSDLDLPHLKYAIPHPQGCISVDLLRDHTGDSAVWVGTITLPENCTGRYQYAGMEIALVGGRNLV